jgi:hypothetical protein
MTEVSYVDHFRDETVLRRADRQPRPSLELPPAEYTETMYDDVFRDAQAKLGFEGIEPTYERHHKKLIAPDGYMFRVTGMFEVWSDGNHMDWGYGPPTYSYEKWRTENQDELADMEASGLSPEEAEHELLEDCDCPCDPDLRSFNGKSISLYYNGVSWGSMVDPEKVHQQRLPADKTASVELYIDSFRQTWHGQARKFVKLPNTSEDRLLRTYEYGMPGAIPCWKGQYCCGDIDHMAVELVPIEEGEGDRYLPPLNRLWLPESVRWSLYKKYPDLIDQEGDDATRSSWGNAMRILGGLASGMSGHDGNAFDDFAEQGRSNIVAVDHPMLAHMDLDELAAGVERMIEKSNNSVPLSDEAKRREEEAKKEREKIGRKLLVVTRVNQPIFEIAENIGKSDNWLDQDTPTF